MKPVYLFAVLFFLMTFGCTFGLTSAEDCRDRPSTTAKMDCYHLAALSEANTPFFEQEAMYTCYQITTVAAEAELRGVDLKKKAEVEKNNCLYDVAKALARRGFKTEALSACDVIAEEDVGWAVVGAPITKEMCDKQVATLSKINFEDYHEDGICAIVFIFPLLVITVLISQNKNP